MAEFKNILLATDFSKSSLAALKYAEALVRRNEGELHVVHVQPASLPVIGVGAWPDEIEITPEQKQELLKKLEAYTAEINVPVVAKVLWSPSVPTAINDYVTENSMDLLVLGTHARSGLARLFLGSVAAELVRSASISCLVVGAEQTPNPDGFQHIVVGMDFSPAALAALRAAVTLSEEGKTRITALHAFDPTTLSPYYVYHSEADDRAWAQKEFTKTLASLNLSMDIERMVVMGRPHVEIVQHVRDLDADFLVVGSHGRGMLERLLMGSVSERVLRAAPCAVLVHREPAKNV